jgi:hypothetical protein
MWENAKFNTRVQKVDQLQNREPMKKKSRTRHQRKRKRRKCLRFGMTRRRSTNVSETNDCTSDADEKFGFQSGADYTLDAFQKYADEFKAQYFGMGDSENILTTNEESQKSWEPSTEEIEGEYWRIVENPTEEVEVSFSSNLCNLLLFFYWGQSKALP